MAASMNVVVLLGNLTRDPELRSTQSGTALCKFGLAVDRHYKDKKETCFVMVTVWGDQAETVNKFMKKGDPIAVKGRLESWEHETKDGEKKTMLGVVAENVQFLRGREEKPRDYEDIPI